MPKQISKLLDKDVKSAKPTNKAYKLYDGEGLTLLVRPSGTKVWQYPYKLHGKNNIYTIGQYPEIGLALARQMRDEARKLVSNGIAPIEGKANHKLPEGAKNSFGTVGLEWLNKQIWVTKHKANITRQLSQDIFHYIGDRTIRSISRQDIYGLLQRIEEREAYNVAKRTAQHCVQIFDYALLKGLCDSNPAIGLSKTIKNIPVKHRAYLEEHQISHFLEKLEEYPGTDITKLAMKFLMLTFVRPGELRGALWKEINFAKAEWRIPAIRMKMKNPHIVPLTKYSLEILEEAKKISGTCELIFPGKDATKPISDATLTRCLERMGFKGIATAHGMRAMASTILNESNFMPDWVEKQLAHMPKDKIRAAYNHALHLADRRQMVEWWGEYLVSKGMKCGKCDSNIL
jgi:integrase